MKACKHYAILLIIIFKRKLSLLSQTVANIFTLIEPTAASAAASKEENTVNCLFMKFIELTSATTENVLLIIIHTIH